MSDITRSQVIGGGLCIVAGGLLSWFWNRPGVFSKMLVVVHQNPLFYLLMFGGLAYAAWRRYRRPDLFVWLEVPVQLLFGGLALYLLTAFFFYVGSDLEDREIWNGHATHVVYQEEYDDETCTESCDEDGYCTETCTCSTYGPYYTIHTQNEMTLRREESVATSSTVYQRYVSHFGNERSVGSRGDGCAGNRGTTWQTDWPGGDDTRVPTAVEHPYVNYVKAVAAIRAREQEQTSKYEPLLVSYPRVHDGPLGPIYLDRVLDPADLAPAAWRGRVSNRLAARLSTAGPRYQVNVLVYLVDTPEEQVTEAIERAWKGVNKNDVVVVLGAPEYPAVSWVRVLSWARDPRFGRRLARRITELQDLSEDRRLVQLILDQIGREEAGFERVPMAEMEHMAGEARVVWWAQLATVLSYMAIVLALSYALEQNSLTDYRARRAEE